MRREPTPAEGRLWKLLRAYQLNGLKFRRQHPLGGFIVISVVFNEVLSLKLMAMCMPDVSNVTSSVL